MKHTAHILFFDNQQLTLQFPFGDVLVQFRVEWPDSRQDGLLAISSTAGYQSRGGEEGGKGEGGWGDNDVLDFCSGQ